MTSPLHASSPAPVHPSSPAPRHPSSPAPAHPRSPAPQHIAVIGMGYVGIPCAALFADVPGFRVTGVQRRSPRSAWKIDCLNAGQSPFGVTDYGVGRGPSLQVQSPE
jgi:hypothetical protein